MWRKPRPTLNCSLPLIKSEGIATASPDDVAGRRRVVALADVFVGYTQERVRPTPPLRKKGLDGNLFLGFLRVYPKKIRGIAMRLVQIGRKYICQYRTSPMTVLLVIARSSPMTATTSASREGMQCTPSLLVEVLASSTVLLPTSS